LDCYAESKGVSTLASDSECALEDMISEGQRLLAAGAHTTVSHLAQVPALMGLSAA
jgi:hypothetical protein